MFAAKNQQKNQTIQLSILEKPEAPVQKESPNAAQQAELRRQMYERMAEGNALSEAEDKASRHWNK